MLTEWNLKSVSRSRRQSPVVLIKAQINKRNNFSNKRSKVIIHGLGLCLEKVLHVMWWQLWYKTLNITQIFRDFIFWGGYFNFSCDESKTFNLLVFIPPTRSIVTSPRSPMFDNRRKERWLVVCLTSLESNRFESHSSKEKENFPFLTKHRCFNSIVLFI